MEYFGKTSLKMDIFQNDKNVVLDLTIEEIENEDPFFQSAIEMRQGLN